ncbi:transglycosylase domain-containing protein [Chryseolinea sp. H1M3-3]|uniref:transglycosylase domain-containing protein n=1 Tax=Chryseolinea sp. H1M3-3 TaxID=3034144 RepID=UPI0023EBD66A|nr:transglycosylase domain-containing protein [Chryseolinea sp. H1M3-3]
MLRKIKRTLLLRRPWFPKAIKAIWIFFFCLIIGLPLYVYSVRIDLFGLFGGMPSLKAISNPENDLSSELISEDGVSLGRYFLYNRSQVTYAQLSPDLVRTLLYSEDHRFYDHSGLDFQAYLRAIYGVLTFSSSTTGGGSTLTQQLAKNLYTQDPELDGSLAKLGELPRRIIQKTKEWIISVHLERNFTKEEIITMYLNTTTWSSNAYGIKVAAETYFKKHPKNLNLQESAVLVGMLQNPSLFHPKFRPQNSLKKRNQVLAKVFEHGYIKASTYDSLIQLPIELNYSVQNQNAGVATYFRAAIEKDLMTWCKKHGYNLNESGLKIYTTINSRMQRYAVEAMNESMKLQQKTFDAHWKGRNPWIDENRNELPGFLESRIKQTNAYRNLVKRYGENTDSINIMLRMKKPMTVFTWNGDRDTLFSSMDSLNYYKRFLQAGFMSMDPHTGAVKAWVGGINHKYFKYDHVRQGTRQPGSTFKAFVYGTAIEAGYNPCFRLQDISPTFNLAGGATWTPANAAGDRGTGASLTLRQALALSKNSITAQVLQRVGAENVVDFARRAGIKSPIDPVPALCLGVSDVSLYELIGAYSTFVNLGIYTEPFFITRIEDKNGNVIESFIPEKKQAINEATAFKMIYMLMGGVEEEGGNSQTLDEDLIIDNEIGAKTGTTNNASDGWYIGITHNLVAGAWVGGDERSIHYREWALGQGGRTARPIWEKYMLKVYADRNLEYKKGAFKRPAELNMTIDCSEFDTTEDPSPFEPNN